MQTVENIKYGIDFIIFGTKWEDNRVIASDYAIRGLIIVQLIFQF